MLILGIETSCDETSAAVIKDGREVLSNIIYSQIDVHKQFGGVVPEIASRKHTEKISFVVDSALREANVSLFDIDLIAVSTTPGLVGSLLVGLSFAKALSYALERPFIGVNHIEGHIYANFITYKELEPPLIVLVVSGGHTNLLVMEDHSQYTLIGKTRDDAAGEAFDKIARYLDLGYPGGPIIDKLSQTGDENKYNFPEANLENPYDFSFSGIKSAVINFVNSMRMKHEEFKIEDIAASFQKTVVNTLTKKTVALALEKNIKRIALAGGVAANKKLRQEMENLCLSHSIELFIPKFEYCTDNAAMIASAGYFSFIKGKTSDYSINAIPYMTFSSKTKTNNL